MFNIFQNLNNATCTTLNSGRNNQHRCYSTLSTEQKDKIANGPDFHDFIEGNDNTVTVDTTDISPSLKKKKGER